MALMKTLMHNIKWEHVNCHICNSYNVESIKINGIPLVEGQFGYVVYPVICKNCGLVFLGKRWTKEFYSIFYKYYYDDLYRLEIKPDYGIEAVINNMKEIYERILPFVFSNEYPLNILDLGASSGHGLKYLGDQLTNSKLFAIESSPECCEILTSREIGAELISNDFDLPWEDEYENSMNIIIMRHVFEHVLDPLTTLRKIRKSLANDGILYISVPDIINIRTDLRDYDNWWEYIFRSVHTYYYSKSTFIQTLKMAKLYPLKIVEENDEIWAVISKNELNEFQFVNQYDYQLKTLNNFFSGEYEKNIIPNKD